MLTGIDEKHSNKSIPQKRDFLVLSVLIVLWAIFLCEVVLIKELQKNRDHLLQIQNFIVKEHGKVDLYREITLHKNLLTAVLILSFPHIVQNTIYPQRRSIIFLVFLENFKILFFLYQYIRLEKVDFVMLVTVLRDPRIGKNQLQVICSDFYKAISKSNLEIFFHSCSSFITVFISMLIYLEIVPMIQRKFEIFCHDTFENVGIYYCIKE